MSVKSPLVPQDLYRIEYVNEPQLAPDGTRIAWVETRADREKNEYVGALWVAEIDGSRRSQIVGFDGGRVQFPRWCPEGRRLAFLRRNQIWVTDLSTGATQQLTHGEPVLSMPAWSPDGKAIAYTTRRPKTKEESETDVRVYTTLNYKADGVGFLDPRPAQVWRIPVGGGQPVQMTQESTDCVAPIWSPDGSSIAYAVMPSFGWRITLKALPTNGGDPWIVTEDATLPFCRFSPDGRWVLFIGGDLFRLGSHSHPMIVPVHGGTPTDLISGWDRGALPRGGCDVSFPAPYVPEWDGSHVYFLISDAGNVSLYRVEVRDGKSGQPEKVFGSGPRTVSAFHVAAGTVAAAVNSPTETENIYTLHGNREVRLTDANAELLANVETSMPQEFTFVAADGLPIHAWLAKPPGPGPHPLVLSIHGGPHSMYGWSFNFERQMLVNHGYAVLWVNPRGSDGYGLDFSMRVRNDLGGKDMHDLLSAVEEAIKLGDIDRERMGVMGLSYGGFMTNWIITRDHRFKAAITENSLTNHHSSAGTSDSGYWQYQNMLGASVVDGDATLLKFSPLLYVRNVQTPLLILHGEEDHRCPIGQAEQFFTALRYLGKEAVFVRYPGESHMMRHIGRIRSRVDRLARVLAWWQQYLGEGVSAPR